MSDETATRGGPTLLAKLVEVMGAVKRIPKRGYNKHFDYKFATEGDVVERIRIELVKRNVLLVPEILTADRIDGKGLTQIHMRFSFIDADSGVSMQQSWFAQGGDTQDKGVSKAATSGEKYFLLKFFLIPTGDDPDSDGPLMDDEPKKKKDLKPSTSEALLTKDQSKRLGALMKTHHTNVDEFKAWVEARFHVTESKALKQKDYEAICRYVVEGVDTTA